jgi:ABC-2 type transport system permease protein
MTDFFARLWAIIIKEALQLRRDRLTFAMMFTVPIAQLLMFGFAINADPRGLPTAVLISEHSALSRDLVQAITNTGYFTITAEAATEPESDDLLQRGQVQFVITIPPDLTRKLVRGEKAQIAIEADATDPMTTGPALNAVTQAVTQTLARDLTGPLASKRPKELPVDVVVHRRYNPESITRYNIVPGLLGIILTMTTVMMTAMAVTRERERGTMENLLAMPVKPFAVMAGKIVPYIVVSSVQVAIIVSASGILFGIPFTGSFTLFGVATLLFITINLAIGFAFSTIAKSQLQAMQMSIFFLLPSIVLSGFAFPFRGMPGWARVIGEVLPTTHFLRIVRGVMLKAATADQLSHELAILAFMLVIVVALAISRYRVTLD